jgi:hypothetical protein
MRVLPELAAKLTHVCDGWIVGSAADPENKSPRDYDIVIPFNKWREAAALIPKDSKRNTFGGWKCISENKEIDVWPDELGWILTKPMVKFAWHPFSGTRISKL